MNIEKIIKEANFTDEEKDFLEKLPIERDSVIETARITSELLLGKKIETAANKIIDSNKELEKSNKEHSKIIVGLTTALVLVGIVQAAIAFVTLFESILENYGLQKAIIVEVAIFVVVFVVLWSTRSFWRKVIPRG